MALPLLLAATAAGASGAIISMPDFTIDRGSDATVELTLTTDGDRPMAYSGLQFDMYLPEGLGLKEATLDEGLDAEFSLSVTEYGDGSSRLIAFTDGTGVSAGQLMRLTFACAETVKRGEGKIYVRNVIFSTPDGRDIDLDDSEATVFFNAYGTAETPLQLLRKGDGRSCTFVCMMPVSNEQIETEGYRFVYGYDSADGTTTSVIADTSLRYCHTSEEIYNDSSLDFWVFAYYTDDEGTLCVSRRRHLDGRVDDDFDPESYLETVQQETTRAIADGVYTLDGRYVGPDTSHAERGIYIIRTPEGSVKFIR